VIPKNNGKEESPPTYPQAAYHTRGHSRKGEIPKIEDSSQIREREKREGLWAAVNVKIMNSRFAKRGYVSTPGSKQKKRERLTGRGKTRAYVAKDSFKKKGLSKQKKSEKKKKSQDRLRGNAYDSK